MRCQLIASARIVLLRAPCGKLQLYRLVGFAQVSKHLNDSFVLGHSACGGGRRPLSAVQQQSRALSPCGLTPAKPGRNELRSCGRLSPLLPRLRALRRPNHGSSWAPSDMRWRTRRRRPTWTIGLSLRVGQRASASTTGRPTMCAARKRALETRPNESPVESRLSTGRDGAFCSCASHCDRRASHWLEWHKCVVPSWHSARTALRCARLLR